MRARGGLAPSFRLCSSFWSRAPLLCRDCRGVRARAGGPPGGEHGGVEAHDDVCGVFTSAYVCCVGSVRPIILFVSLISSHSQHAHLDLRPHTKRRHVQAERVCRDGTCSTPRPARCPLLGDDEGDHAAHRASRGQEPTPSGSPPASSLWRSAERGRMPATSLRGAPGRRGGRDAIWFSRVHLRR